MFLKQEKSERDDFERRKKLVQWKNSIFQENIVKTFVIDTLAKMSQNISAYSFVSEHLKHNFFVFFEKTFIF